MITELESVRAEETKEIRKTLRSAVNVVTEGVAREGVRQADEQLEISGAGESGEGEEGGEGEVEGGIGRTEGSV